MKIQHFDHEDALAAALATRLLHEIARHPQLVLGLPTGRTPLSLYRELRERTARERIDWSRVRTFNLDEFVGLGGTDAGSYRAFMAAELFREVPINPSHIEMLDGRAPNIVEECRRYESAIAAAGGIDVQILGIGANGHIGFNEPGPELQAHTHVATLRPSTRDANAMRFGGDPDRVPAQAVSMGMATILAARDIVMIAIGEEKADCVAGMINGLITTRLPASFLQLHPRVTVMLDHDAASRLTRE